MLDVFRFAAALAVVITHVCLPEFGTGWGEHLEFGTVAVPVFFVLSGFVIRFVTRTRESSGRDYFIDRASRIYSVVLPALLVTVAAGGVCLLLDRGRFLQDWSSTFAHPVARIALNLAFLSQAWGHNTIPFANLPFWSLGYECPYYVLYGLMFYGRGWARVALLAAVAGLVGPQVLFLLPVWWMGCWVYDAYQWARRQRHVTSAMVGAVAAWGVAAAGMALLGRRAMLLWPVAAYAWMEGLPHPFVRLGIPVYRATMVAMAVGVCCAAVLLVGLLALDGVGMARGTMAAVWVRRVADGTFAIYLMHFPLLMVATFAGWLRSGHGIANGMVVAGVVVTLILASRPIDGLKRWLRGRLRTWAGAVTTRRAAKIRADFG